MRTFIFATALCCTACAETEQVSGDPIDYAAMNEAAEGTAQPIELEPMTLAAMVENGVAGAGCNIVFAGSERPIFWARQDAAYFQLQGEVLSLASHGKSNERLFGVHDHYDGRIHSVDLDIDQETFAPQGPDIATYQGVLKINDAKERLVFEYRGPIQCTAWP